MLKLCHMSAIRQYAKISCAALLQALQSAGAHSAVIYRYASNASNNVTQLIHPWEDIVYCVYFCVEECITLSRTRFKTGMLP